MPNRKRTDYLVIHVTATPPSADIGAKEVDAMHKARGWSGIGYHYVIRRDGTVEKGRPDAAIGAHVAGFNSVSLGISLVGGINAAGKPENNMTPAQFASLDRLLRTLAKKYPDAKVCGHRDLSPDRDRNGIIEPHEHLKACPCFDAIPWAAARGLPAANIRGAWNTTAPSPAGPDERIAWLQTLLRRAGYEFGPVDGIVGPRTRDALKRFQEAAGFKVTGDFDPPTVARLRQMADSTTKEVKVEVPVEVEKQVLPPAVEEKVERESNWWQKLIGFFTGGGLGGGMLYGVEWQTLVAIVGVGALLALVVFLFRRHIIAGVKEIRAGLA